MNEQLFQVLLACLGGLLGVVGVFFCYLGSRVLEEMKTLSSSVASLNEKMAIVVTNQDWHSDSLKKNAEDISDLNHRVQILEALTGHKA